MMATEEQKIADVIEDLIKRNEFLRIKLGRVCDDTASLLMVLKKIIHDYKHKGINEEDIFDASLRTLTLDQLIEAIQKELKS